MDMGRLLAALNSDDMDFFIRHTSRPYQGGWRSYAKSFIKDFPMPLGVLAGGKLKGGLFGQGSQGG